MHRGSSKDGRGPLRPSENLPLSASPDLIDVGVEVARAGATRTATFRLPRGTLVREAVRRMGIAPEGCAVTIDALSVPLDLPIDRPLRLVVVPTFSGG